ncbi:hypothetical protein FRC04_000799 [Tulasnella sp. 424]|nr:hypothetical protein FRC04_000799 [Tulasnella sp. 424]
MVSRSPQPAIVDRANSNLQPIYFIQAKEKASAPKSGGKAAKKKKWSKGKVKDKAQHAVAIDKNLFDRVQKEVPTFRFISVSILIERLKINGSLARKVIQHLKKEGTIKCVVHHSAQRIYTRTTGAGGAD